MAFPPPSLGRVRTRRRRHLLRVLPRLHERVRLHVSPRLHRRSRPDLAGLAASTSCPCSLTGHSGQIPPLLARGSGWHRRGHPLSPRSSAAPGHLLRATHSIAPVLPTVTSGRPVCVLRYLFQKTPPAGSQRADSSLPWALAVMSTPWRHPRGDGVGGSNNGSSPCVHSARLPVAPA